MKGETTLPWSIPWTRSRSWLMGLDLMGCCPFAFPLQGAVWVCVCVCLSVCLSACLPACLSVCLSVCLYLQLISSLFIFHLFILHSYIIFIIHLYTHSFFQGAASSITHKLGGQWAQNTFLSIAPTCLHS